LAGSNRAANRAAAASGRLKQLGVKT